MDGGRLRFRPVANASPAFNLFYVWSGDRGGLEYSETEAPEVFGEHDDLRIHPTLKHNLETVMLLAQAPHTSGRASLRRTDVIERKYIAGLRITELEAMMGLFGGQWRTGTCTTTPGAPLPGIGNSRKHYAGSLCGKAVISLCVQANS